MSQAPVKISEYDPQWPAAFEAERDLLESLIGAWRHGPIEHVGSTAVPGLAAKPVIDVMFGVRSLEASMPAIEVLTGNGYVYFPYKGDVMHWFCKPSDAFRTHHVHLVPFESPLWHERIRFRDILRSEPDVAKAYADLKRSLGLKYQHDREAYTLDKWPFIEAILRRSAEGGGE